ncbi:MAG: hypothetical protein ACLR23_23970 [Clostridia bacterium]
MEKLDIPIEQKPDLQDKHTEFHQDHAGANPAGSQTGGLSAPEIRKTQNSAAGNQFLTAVFQVSARINEATFNPVKI